jgi:hypothetical protein
MIHVFTSEAAESAGMIFEIKFVKGLGGSIGVTGIWKLFKTLHLVALCGLDPTAVLL